MPTPGVPGSHWGGSSAPVFGHVIYIAIAAFVLNVVVAAVLTVVARLVHLPEGTDETLPAPVHRRPGARRARARQHRHRGQNGRGGRGGR